MNISKACWSHRVPFNRDIFGSLPSIKFDEHDLANEDAFLDLEKVLYDNVPKVESMPWACRQPTFGILNFLHIPHFGRHVIAILVVWQLLALIHDGCFWIQGHIPIDAILIHRITTLPMKGPHPINGFGNKYEQKVANKFREKYKVDRDKRGFLVETIADLGVCMGTLVLTHKMMRKCRESTIPTYVI